MIVLIACPARRELSDALRHIKRAYLTTRSLSKAFARGGIEPPSFIKLLHSIVDGPNPTFASQSQCRDRSPLNGPSVKGCTVWLEASAYLAQ